MVLTVIHELVHNHSVNYVNQMTKIIDESRHPYKIIKIIDESRHPNKMIKIFDKRHDFNQMSFKNH